MVSAVQLQIDIFVTNASRPALDNDFLPPRPGFALGSGGRRDSLDSVTSEMSRDGYDLTESLEAAAEGGTYEDVVDLTNYEDEEDINDPAEHHLSEQLQQQGKVRRAKSRKASKKASSGQIRDFHRPTSAYPPSNRHSNYDEADVERQYAAAASGSLLDPKTPEQAPRVAPGTIGGHPRLSSTLSLNAESQPLSGRSPSNPMLSAYHDRSTSYRSLAESTYGRYDPFASAGIGGPRHPSPSPSIMFDDNQSIAGESMRNLISRQSRTQSMVLLEDLSGADLNADDALWIDEADYAAMGILSEMARPGKRKLATVLQEEIEVAKGSLIVASMLLTTPAQIRIVELTFCSLWPDHTEHCCQKSRFKTHLTAEDTTRRWTRTHSDL